MRAFAALFCLAVTQLLQGQEIRMVKSLSGPSGHVSGTKFMFDETRTRFVYPRDKSLIVYFEWAALPGLHTISAVWKAPDGHPAAIPTDVKVETTGPEHVPTSLAAYWIFDIGVSDATGIWTLETRVDGAPAGSHNFELYVPPPANPTVPLAPKQPTTDDAYRATVPSLVLIHSVDASGQRLDTSLGFVFAANLVATAFQSIDGASTILVEFSDGSTAHSLGLAGFDRIADWALIPVPTGSRTPLKQSSSAAARVGDRVLAFTVEGEKNLVAAVINVSGRRQGSGFTAVQINPALPAVSAGSPVLDANGEVFGILGAWPIPGSRIPSPIASVNAAVWERPTDPPGVTPIELVKPGTAAVSLEELAKSGAFTPPLERFPSLLYATTTDVGVKRGDLPERNVTEFSRVIPAVWIVSLWERREKVKSAMISTAVFDTTNRKRAETPTKKVSLGDTSNRLTTSVPLANLEPGAYRVDIYADGKAVWRKFIRVTE